LNGRVILITGGARSGKSDHALKIGNEFDGKKAFLATCVPLDDEMKKRVSIHRLKRGDLWQTHEEPIYLSRKIMEIKGIYQVLLIDCLTIWLSNLIEAFGEQMDSIEREISELEELCRVRDSNLILVSNEVGSGIVPANPLGRYFRDLAGLLNQRIARVADELIFMVCGVPWKLK
jgi:adenosylcobinamide kinase/adenosylcobinamide-phosphate guanylyltransferase